MTFKIQVEPLKQKGENTKQKKKINFSCNFFIGAVITAIAIIVVVNTICTLVVCFSGNKESGLALVPSNESIPAMAEFNSNEKTSDKYVYNVEMTGAEKIESTMLSSGIAIIGVAVAVWAGLNILKALEKNQYKQLEEEIHNIEEERKTFSHHMILDSISKLDDELNQYLFMQLKDLTIEYIDAKTFSKLNSIESRFQELYRKHYANESINPESYNNDFKKIKALFSEIDSLSAPIQPIINKYLNVRCAEMHFYLGYDDENKNSNVSHMTEAITFYLKSFPEMKNPDGINVATGWFTENIKLNTYLLNTIGEAHRVIVQNGKYILLNEKYEEIKTKTLDYFKKMKESLKIHSDKSIHRELYYRDYGCAIEMVEGINCDTFYKMADAYKKSIDITLQQNSGNKENYKPFKVYISLIHKCCDKLFHVKLINLEESKYNILPDIDVFKQPFDDNKDKITEWFEKQRIKTKAYLDIAIAKFPDSMEFLKHKAFYYRDIALYEYLCGKTSEFEENRNLMNKVIEQLKNLIDEKEYDPFMLSIRHQYDQICDYK